MSDSIFSFKRIFSDSHEEVQRVLDSAPTYYMKVEGVPKMAMAGKNIFVDLPPNMTNEDKYVYFIELEGKRIGIAEMIIGYPNSQTAFIGLFLLDERYHGRGIGKKSYEALEAFIKKNFPVNVIELGVNDTNDIGMGFWTKLGFVRNGRSRDNIGIKVNSTVYVLAKNLN